jgi:hypothetical protein
MHAQLNSKYFIKSIGSILITHFGLPLIDSLHFELFSPDQIIIRKLKKNSIYIIS